jgi:tetratricopeptide (TPR) repeat protein
LAAAVLLATFSFRLLAADRQLKIARDHLEAGRVVEGGEAYRQAREWQPPGMNTDLWFSRSMASAAQKSPDLLTRLRAFQVALEAADRAAAHSEDRPNAWYNLAAFHARRNDFTKTEESLRQAIASSPTWYKPHWMLAQVLRAAGRVDDARAESKLAVELGGGKHSEVMRTWEELREAWRR